jgi:hypothetical protein
VAEESRRGAHRKAQRTEGRLLDGERRDRTICPLLRGDALATLGDRESIHGLCERSPAPGRPIFTKEVLVTRTGLVIACPAERYFGDIKAQAARLVGVDDVLTYDDLRITVQNALARGGYEFILIAGHGQMNEMTGAGVMLGRLSPIQWTQVVNIMRGRHMTAPVVILDGCKSASFLTTFTGLVEGNGYVVCNVGDSSTTVFGQLDPERTLADAVDAKRQIELAIRPRPGRPLIAPVPDGASAYSDGQLLQPTGGGWEFSAYPGVAIVDVDPKLNTPMICWQRRSACEPGCRRGPRVCSYRPRSMRRRIRSSTLPVRMPRIPRICSPPTSTGRGTDRVARP